MNKFEKGKVYMIKLIKNKIVISVFILLIILSIPAILITNWILLIILLVVGLFIRQKAKKTKNQTGIGAVG